jgi:hypothetical protein
MSTAVDDLVPAADNVDWPDLYQRTASYAAVGLFGFYAGTQTLGLRVARLWCPDAVSPTACSAGVARTMQDFTLVPWAAAACLLVVGIIALTEGDDD